MMTGQPLTRLAALYGIEPRYADAWGQTSLVPEETKRSLLAAMGVEAGDDRAVARSLEAAGAEKHDRLLDPTVVVKAKMPGAIPLPGPEGKDGRLAWRLTLESGGVFDGTERLSDLPSVAGGGRRLALPKRLPPGYHRFHLEMPGGREADCCLAVAPAQCLDPAKKLPGGRGWGLAVQLYGLRSEGNWGIGDFGDLARLAEGAAAHGAQTLNISPIHALFAADPNHYGPYAPSSRAFLNVLHIDVAAAEAEEDVPEARRLIASAAFGKALAAARAGELLDYPQVSRLKRPVLEAIHRAFRARHPEGAPDDRGRAFLNWCDSRSGLREHAVFEALHEHFFATDPDRWSWHSWPLTFQDHAGPEVGAFAKARAERVGYHAWLQWLAERQLARAQQAARQAGMGIGLACDLAVAAHPGGSMAWNYPQVVLGGAHVGAPPDAFNPFGQDWGLAPLSPAGLRATGFRPFIAALQARMRHAGMIRIDHAMCLQRLYCIPAGAPPDQGAYLGYPFQTLRRLVALESLRNDCCVVGEDLGTVPPGFREAMRQSKVLSYRVVWFERTEGERFRRLAQYPDDAVVAATTHDLPTIRGYWQGQDLEWRRRLGLFRHPGDIARADEQRRHDKAQLLQMLRRAGLLGTAEEPEAERLTMALLRLVARAPSRLMIVQLEDVIGELEQANLPGTVAAHPNWRRRLASSLEALLRDSRLARLGVALAEEGRKR